MSTAATIPMAGDLADLIGPAAERVENRSLLLDKFVFHKKWPVVEEQTRRGREFVKWDEASRWSFMRIADGAAQILHKDAAEKRRRAMGNNVEPENRDRYNAEARIASSLAGVRWDSKELDELRANHTRRFISLFRTAYGDRATVTIGQLEGRLAINLADSLIQNAGICLDRLFGLPYIPGSAIKGVCRHTAVEDIKAAPDSERPSILRAFCAVFGTAENDFVNGDLSTLRAIADQGGCNHKGGIAFLPAYPVNEARIVVDLTNVHYPDYYRGGRADDLSKENPRPNPFPAVETGAQFAFCLLLNGIVNDVRLIDHARRWLIRALTERGLGAKTAAGYGWFSIAEHVLQAIEEENQKAAAVAERAAEARRQAEEAAKAEVERKASLSPEQAGAEDLLSLNDEGFSAFAKQIASKDEPLQRAFLHLLTQNKEKRARWKAWKKKKPEIVAGIHAIATKLNMPLP